MLCNLFTRYLRHFFRRSFHGVRLSRHGLPAVMPGKAVILCINHPSWWDPALFLLLMPILFPDRVGFGPMDGAALGRYGLFRRMGIFGLPPGPAGARRFLQAGAHILADPRHMLWITAQGSFVDPRQRPVRLRPGIGHLARGIPDAMVLPLAIEYSFWNERFPEVLIRFGPPVRPAAGASIGDSIGVSAAQWTQAMEQGLETTMDALAADAISRDPTRFHTLLDGRTGVGGVYDMWRRWAARRDGRRFQPGHETGPEWNPEP